MTVWICWACGAEHPDTPEPPASCPICVDDRQYVPAGGQRWTSAADLLPRTRFEIAELEADLFGIVVKPSVAIGQRTLLLRTTGGNLLWEPSAFVSPGLVDAVRDLGGVAAVAASHPHLAGAAVSWSHEFGGVPVYWNADDRRWIQRPDAGHTFWRETVEPVPGVSLVQTGGHFPGSAVLHWPAGAGGRGVLLSGDTIMVTPRRTVSFMRSYPNLLPLPERLVRQIADTVLRYRFDRIYGLFEPHVVASGAAGVVRESADRYVGWLRDELRDPDEGTG